MQSSSSTCLPTPCSGKHSAKADGSPVEHERTQMGNRLTEDCAYECGLSPSHMMFFVFVPLLFFGAQCGPGAMWSTFHGGERLRRVWAEVLLAHHVGRSPTCARCGPKSCLRTVWAEIAHSVSRTCARAPCGRSLACTECGQKTTRAQSGRKKKRSSCTANDGGRDRSGTRTAL